MIPPGSAPSPTGPIRPLRDGLVVGLTVLAMSLLSIAFLERGARDAVQGETRNDLIRSAELASAMVDGDTMKAIGWSEDESSPRYAWSVARLRKALSSCRSIRYLYTMRMDGDSLRFVLDASPPFLDSNGIQQHSRLGESYRLTTPSMLETLRSGIPTSEEEPVMDQWGLFISGYAPIRDGKDSVVGLVGVDVTPDTFLSHQRNLHLRALLAQGIMVLFSFLTGFFVWQSQDRRRSQEVERQEAQKRLLLSEEKYRMLFETAGTAIVVFGPDRQIRMINRICENAYGWSRTEVEGKLPWTHFIHPDDLPRCVEYVTDRRAGIKQAPSQYDCRLAHRDGSYRHVTFSLAEIPGSELMVCSLVDRTSLVQAWEELEESRRRYQVIFEVTDTPMLVFDEQNVVRLANESCLKLVQVSREELEGRSWASYIHPEDLATLLEEQEATTGTPGPWRMTQRIVTREGGIRHLSFVVSRLPGTSWCIAAGLDLTERIEAEAAMKDLNAHLDHLVKERTTELETALRSREDFLSSMSHELRTPLQSIEASTEILLEDLQGPEADGHQVRHLKTIQRSSSHLLTLISDILDLAKSMAGHLQLRTTTVAVQAICRESLDLVASAAQRRGLKLRLDCPQDQLALEADPVRLKQMLANVLGNSIKFTPSGGEILLEVRTDPDRIRFAVRDTGIGISPEDQARLFQPFVQLDNSLARIHAGTGLGLALVQRLANAHGGSVALESTPSFGTTVTLSLPWEGQTTLSLPPQESSASTAGIPRSVVDSPLVLLAEDNVDIRECVCEYLEGLGYWIETAGNGLEVLEKAAATMPDLVLMDVQMPYMDGLEATRRLRQDPAFRSLPIIAMTALAQESDSQRCLDAGADSYLSKPVRLKDLASAVASMCRPQGGNSGA